ncbi:S1C family serine protease [Frondihabitans australicus]|uniref:Putative serine protease PepD n=1 Tax=Frondihabitans australicus TaxID=386892 RepID=A0A495IG44_9MICO|nr:trypsin-like peptidase domain-containing protein [Frondihabitans australicus]RKR74719.1 putative serine protease PepD [Frondihabitans australicus]
MTDTSGRDTPDGAGSNHDQQEAQAPAQETQAPAQETQAPAQETPAAAPRWEPPVGAPPLPGTPPAPLSAQQQPTGASGEAAAEPGRRVPASLDHAAYAGPHSAAYGDLSAAAARGEYPDAAAQAEADAHSWATAGSAEGGWAAPATRPRRKAGLGAFVAVAIVAAVIGALVSSGVWAFASSRGTAVSSGTADSLTIGHYKDATVITAVAAKATQSVVTINASSGQSAGTGSGVVLTSDGYIVTNTHVVTLDGASSSATVSVTTAAGRIYAAKVIGTDPLVDLAVIKIDASGLKPMDFADSSKLNVGDTAVAIGAPLGLSNTVTDGIVSTLNRSISVASSAAPSGGDSSGGTNDGQQPFNFDQGNGSGSSSGSSTTQTISLPVIQTDASINPGNSGGALLDSKGDLIGVNVAIASSGDSSGSIGVGFSIPSNLVKRVSSSIIKTGSATHGVLGAAIDDATSDSAATHTGAEIKSLTSGGAAEAAGLRAGDIITAVDGVSITGATDLQAQVRTLAGGATASVTYIRDGRSKTVTVTLGTQKG